MSAYHRSFRDTFSQNQIFEKTRPKEGRYGGRTDRRKAADPEEEEGEKDKRPMLALPAPSDAKRSETNTLKLGENVKFDKLGPVVINSDGTISRIANWDKMTETEKETTYRVLVKRNNLRRKRLLEQQEKSKQKLNENS